MPINWSRGLSRMLKTMGNQWTTTVNGRPIEFWGIFNTADGLQDVEGGGPQKLITVTTLMVLTEHASQFVMNQELREACSGKVWYATRQLRQDDGLMTEMLLVEKPS